MADEKKFVVIRNRHTAPIEDVAPGAVGRIEGIDERNPAIVLYAAGGQLDVLESSQPVVQVIDAPASETPAADPPAGDATPARATRRG